ncbi:MAG: MYXO-CTERM sorting domain-containing protein [Pirellulaceae bacterium]
MSRLSSPHPPPSSSWMGLLGMGLITGWWRRRRKC